MTSEYAELAALLGITEKDSETGASIGPSFDDAIKHNSFARSLYSATEYNETQMSEIESVKVHIQRNWRSTTAARSTR